MTVDNPSESGRTWENVLTSGVRWFNASGPAKDAAYQLHCEIKEDYKRAKGGGEVALYLPVGAVAATHEDEFHMSFNNAAIHFDWSAAWPLNFELCSLAEGAEEWWPVEREDRKEPPKWGPSAVVNRIVGKDDEVSRFSELRWPHLIKAWGLATWMLGAIKQENEGREAPEGGALPAPSETFKARIANYTRDMEVAKQRFIDAAQRTAQSRYWRGTLVGAGLLVVICALIGAIFWWRGTPAAYGVAIPAGALGAMVSLLQRMSSGKLVLDLTASRDLLEVFGAVRPFIGAVFGIAIAALLAGGLAPVIEVPDGQELAFYAGVGFLAGFNERWAQDMLKSSAPPTANAPSDGTPQPPAKGEPASGELEQALARPEAVPADLSGDVDKGE